MHRIARGLAACAIACVGLAACAGFTGDDTLGASPDRSQAPSRDAAAGADSGDDGAPGQPTDAGSSTDSAASSGDPALRREPRLGCASAATDDVVGASFPGWEVFRYLGFSGDTELAPSFELLRCDDVFSLSLFYGGGLANRDKAPAFGFGRTLGISGPTSMSYVVEGVTQADEDEEAFVGGLALSVLHPVEGAYGLSMSFGRRPATGEILLRKRRLLPNGGGYADDPPLALGNPSMPYRVEWVLDRGASALQLVSRLTITDGTSQRVEVSVDDVPDAEVVLQLGLNRINPNNRSRLTVSALVLP